MCKEEGKIFPNEQEQSGGSVKLEKLQDSSWSLKLHSLIVTLEAKIHLLYGT